MSVELCHIVRIQYMHSNNCYETIATDFQFAVILIVSDETLTGQTNVCGVLMLLAGVLKHGKRDDLIEFGKQFI